MNTLLFIPYVERDYPITLNCTKEILTIKSLSPSKFNEIKTIASASEEIIQIEENKSDSDSSTEEDSNKKPNNGTTNGRTTTTEEESKSIFLKWIWAIIPIGWFLYEAVVNILNRRKKSKKIPHLYTIIARKLDLIKERRTKPKEEIR